MTTTYIPTVNPNNGNQTTPSTQPATAVGASIVTGGALELCLRPDSSGAARIETCQKPGDQQFTFVRGQIRDAAGQCLDLQNANPNPGAVGMFTACATDFSAPTQLWTLSLGHLYFTEASSNASLCLVSATGNLTPGAGLQLQACLSTSTTWIAAPQGMQLSNDANQCLTPVADGNGTLAPQLTACAAGDANQMWTLNNNNLVPLANPNSCMEAAYNTPNVPATLAPCDPANQGQNWLWAGYDGTLRQYAAPGNCLDGNGMAACDPNSAWRMGFAQ